jgi:hypothetical protein
MDAFGIAMYSLGNLRSRQIRPSPGGTPKSSGRHRPGQSRSCRCNGWQHSYHDRPPGGPPFQATNRRTRPLQAPKSAADPSDSGPLPIHERFRGRCNDPTGWCPRPRAERFLTVTSPPPVIGLRHCNQKKPPKGRAAPQDKSGGEGPPDIVDRSCAEDPVRPPSDEGKGAQKTPPTRCCRPPRAVLQVLQGWSPALELGGPRGGL